MQSQCTRLAVVIPPVMGNIQVDFIRKALNLPFRADALVVDEKQVNISCAAK
ncbi:unnamed protein product [marine sediment metagenome]|uniref:Uncharacterized protein n=1 Tax=marine sediment metagenome TaxID=412755 RepID=X1UN78_9ZZZZ